eukprot:jgi/Botrbrau1/1807/Bobra.146_1s0006.1
MTLCMRGVTKKILGRYIEALADLDLADSIQPNDASTLGLRGATKVQLAEYHSALGDLDRANRLMPNCALILRWRAAAKGMLSMHQAALADLDRVDALKPDDAYTLAARGMVKLRLGLLEGALADVEAAVAASRPYCDRGQAAALAARGAVKLALGDVAGAREDELSALAAHKLAPKYRPGTLELGYEVLGRLVWPVIPQGAPEVAADSKGQDRPPPLCVVCWDRPCDTIFPDCRHVCACQSCSQWLVACPACTRAGTAIRIYHV